MIIYTNAKHNKIGSSETIRETTFNFEEYKKLIPKHKNKFNQEFNEYFIGFFEGNGSLLINPMNNKIEFNLYQHVKNISILYNLRTMLGFGIISLDKNDPDRAIFKISNQKNLYKIIYLLNGNLISIAKRDQFKLFLDAFNKKYGTFISYKPVQPDLSLKTAWLSGFIDSLGSFSYKRLERINGSYIINPIFYLSSVDKNLLENIRKLFIKDNSNIYFDSFSNEYIFKFGAKRSRVKLIRYLQRYTLKTRKYILYLTWRNLHFFLIKNRSLDHQNSVILTNLIRRIDIINKKHGNF